MQCTGYKKEPCLNNQCLHIRTDDPLSCLNACYESPMDGSNEFKAEVLTCEIQFVLYGFLKGLAVIRGGKICEVSVAHPRVRVLCPICAVVVGKS